MVLEPFHECNYRILIDSSTLNENHTIGKSECERVKETMCVAASTNERSNEKRIQKPLWKWLTTSSKCGRKKTTTGEEPIKCVTAYRGEKSKTVRERTNETRTTKNATGKIKFINERNEENQWECIVHTRTHGARHSDRNERNGLIKWRKKVKQKKNLIISIEY